MNTLNCRGRLLDISKPIVMGILNVTPDSFFDGGRYVDLENMMGQVRNMIAAGAEIIDVGGMSSKPGAEIIDEAEEMQRVLPAIEWIAKEYPHQITSIDTIHSTVAQAAMEAGAHMINDISGGDHDPSIVDVAVAAGAPYVLMHMQGQPEDMQKKPTYTDVVLEVLKELNTKVRAYRAKGLKDIVLDPGFGFGKTVEHNYELLRHLAVFQIADCPVLAGLSRKSMICKPLHIHQKDALNGTTALHMVALQNGAKILRVHDVKEAKECIALYELVSQGK